MPVWHASVTIQDRSSGYRLASSSAVEALAVDLLADDVGKTDGEWWLFSGNRVGHLRVGITDEEALAMWPDGTIPIATADAGPEGIYRPRTMPNITKEKPMTIELATLHLDSGSHNRRDQGVCIMEAVAWLAGEPHSDHPTCASPLITNYAMGLNDQWDDQTRQRLIPYMSQIVGTADDHDNQRGLLAADWLIRIYTPTWLRLAGLNTEADNLANAAPLTDWSAWDVAGDAARDAARAALEPTVGDLQESALELLDRMCQVGR